jgi:3-hydroxyisobutyrate dehydrogenase-like beta-hydroxyacid dehydrogenase
VPGKLRIGYIGVGLMGLPMLKRLLSLGYTAKTCDIAADRVAAATAAGAQAAQSPAQACADVDLVVLNLPTTEAVEAVVFGEAGVATAIRPPQLVIDFSTIKVEKCKAFAERLRAATGCGWIDAPVSGGPPASGTGTLTIMAEAMQRTSSAPASCSPTSRALHSHGAERRGDGGEDAKSTHRRLRSCRDGRSRRSLPKPQGIDAARLPECLAGGHADGSLLQKLYPRMQRRDFAPLGYARQLLKDLEMVNEFAGGLKAPIPMTGEALSLYRILVHLGHSELDTAALVKVYER